MRSSVLYFSVFTFLWAGCTSSKNQNMPEVERHWIELSRPSVGVMYIDTIPLTAIMKVDDEAEMNKKFKAYLVGFRDSSSVVNKEVEVEKNRYFEFGMQNDWGAVVDGIQVNPAFYQSKTMVSNKVREGIMVFETMGINPDTLIYNDSFGSWGLQKFILKGE